jgi:hypothetical protein
MAKAHCLWQGELKMSANQKAQLVLTVLDFQIKRKSYKMTRTTQITLQPSLVEFGQWFVSNRLKCLKQMDKPRQMQSDDNTSQTFGPGELKMARTL